MEYGVEGFGKILEVEAIDSRHLYFLLGISMVYSFLEHLQSGR